MRVRLTIVLAAVLIGAAVATPASLLALGRHASGAASEDVAFHSRALDSTLHFLIRLPDGYARGNRRYPVVYFLHGLPAGPTSYRAVAWVEDALDHAGRPAFLVVPQGTRRQNGDPEYHDWGPGHDWATALGVELPAYVDAHYRTIPNRGGRAIVGVSAGGYGATSIGLGEPGRFSVVESWSGYFEPTDPTFVGENQQLNRELNAAHVPHAFTTYPGAHTVALWRAHARTWLAMALRRLALTASAGAAESR